MTLGPDPERYADAERRAAYQAEHIPGRRNRDASRILALDVLAELVDGFYYGPKSQVAWALLWAEAQTDLEPHEERLRDDAWKKINDDAERAEWERLGLRR